MKLRLGGVAVQVALDGVDALHEVVDFFGEAGVARALFFKPVEMAVDVGQLAFDVAQSGVHPFKTSVDFVEPPINAVEALVDAVHPSVDAVKAGVDALEAVRHQDRQLFDAVDPFPFTRCHIWQVYHGRAASPAVRNAEWGAISH
jgi:hypothetical protein